MLQELNKRHTAMMHHDPISFSSIRPFDRLAMVYADLAEMREINRAHWLGAMDRKAKCLCITDPASRRHPFLLSTRTELQEQGLGPEQITFIDPKGSFKRGKLSASHLIERLEQECRLAASQGYQACDISCDMVSLHPILSRLQQFLQSLANGFQSRNPSAILLQFPREGLPAGIFRILLQFSLFVVLDGRIRRNANQLPLGAIPAKAQNQAQEVLNGIEQWNRLLDQNTVLFSLLDKHGPALCLVDDKDEIIHWNHAFAAMSGLGRNGKREPVPFASIFSLPVFPVDPPDQKNQQRRTIVGRIKTSEGTSTPVSLFIHNMPETGEKNFWNRLIVVHEPKAASDARTPSSESEIQYQRIFEMSRRGLIRVAENGAILHANPAFAEMLGYSSPQDLIGKAMPWWEQTCVVAEQCRELFHKITMHGSAPQHELEMRTAAGQPRLLLLDAFAAGNRPDAAPSFIAVVEDLTDQKKTDQQLMHQAFHDQLTGLPNKALLMDRIDMALQQSKRRKNALFALAFLDLDNFKAVNDKYGHLLADQLLVKVSQTIVRCVRNVDTVSRFGGDEFVVLMDDIVDENEALGIMNRVREGLSVPLPISGSQGLTCTVSTGLVLSTGYTSATEMLRDADMAMYTAKTQDKGKGRIHLLQPSHGRLTHRRDTLKQDLSGAMDRGEFWLHYQPIFQITGNRVTGFEALIRWKHPQLGLLLPDEFLPLAEKSGHIIPLTHWILGDACSQMRTWQMKYAASPPLTISVNLFLEQFTFPEIVESVHSVLEATGLDERSLKLEFSGKALAQSENVGELLIRLKELDVQLSIDDFGLGCSALLHLQRYPFVPIDNLKIDRSVISRLNDGNDYLEMVWTTIMLAHSLGVEVVAEGVETRQQLKLLREMNCDYAQGYLFSKPLDSKLAGELLNSRVQNNQVGLTSPNLFTPAPEQITT